MSNNIDLRDNLLLNNDELLSSIRYGDLKKVKEIINSVDLPSSNWMEGYELLQYSLKFDQMKIAKLILNYGAEVNSENKEPCCTPLHYFVLNGDIELVKMILVKGANVNAINEDKMTPLHIASKKGMISIVEILLEFKACVNSSDLFSVEDDYAPLHFAVENNNEEIVKLLINNGANVNAKGEFGKTPLHVAIKFGHSHIVRYLIDQGACVHSSFRGGYTTLHVAVMSGSEEDMKLLINKGADVNALNENGLTPLHCVSIKGRYKFVSLLVSGGADINAKTKNNESPLYLAATEGHSLTVKELLKCKPDFKDKSNRLSLHIAVLKIGENYSKIVEFLLKYGFTVHTKDNYSKLLYASVQCGYDTIVEYFLKRGTSVNARYNSDCTLLQIAIQFEHQAVINLLLKCGCDVNAMDKNGHTPLFYAVTRVNLDIVKILLINKASAKPKLQLDNTLLHIIAGQINDQLKLSNSLTNSNVEHIIEIAELLLREGVEVDAINYNGMTALQIAVMNGFDRLVSLLLKHNANIHMRDKEGKTLLHYAVLVEKIDTAKILLDGGININAVDKSLKSALHEAVCVKGSEEVVKLLLKYNSDVNIRDESNKSPIFYATKFYEITKALLDNGANVHVIANNGCSVLHVTIMRSSDSESCEEVLRLLLKHNVDVNSIRNDGMTPFHIAAKNDNLEAVKTLLEYGADINMKCNKELTPYDYVKRLSAINPKIREHIIKLQVASLHVCKQNIRPNIINPENEMRGLYENEIKELKINKIGTTDICFYDILSTNKNKLKSFLKEELLNIIESFDYKIQYPYYDTMLKNHIRQFRLRIERKILLKEAYDFLHSFYNKFMILPYDCFEEIFSYLNDFEIKTFMYLNL